MVAGPMRVRWDQLQIEALAEDDAAERLALDAAWGVARLARGLAVRRTGRGAGSIRPWPGEDRLGPYVDVGWDRDHFYMGFHEWGTKHHPRRPALETALDQYVHF